MRQTRLIERLHGRGEDVRTGASAAIGHSETLVLSGVARALRDVTRAKRTRTGPGIEPVANPHPLELEGRPLEAGLLEAHASDVGNRNSGSFDAGPPHVDQPNADSDGLPLVLMGRSYLAQPERTAAMPEPRAVGQFAAPLFLGLAVAAIALLMTAPLPDIAKRLGVDWAENKPRPRLARLTAAEGPPIAQALLYNPADAAPPVTSLDDQVLLERCESMIARGEVREAREELAKAAAEGHQVARFALAETFDPNVLAAWGLRENVADAGVARTLYQQALAAGDTRAAPRLVALAGDVR